MFGSLGAPELLIILVLLVFILLPAWLFYKWGAGMADRKGYSRAWGWLAVLLGFIGILVIALLSDQSAPQTYIPQTNPKASSVSEELERL